MSFRIPTVLALLFITLILLPESPSRAAEAVSLPQQIPANDPHLRYSGRFDFSDPKAPKCAWPASTVTLKFKGRAAEVEMVGKKGVAWQVSVDGKPAQVLTNDGNAQVLSLAMDLPEGEHTIALVKRTEPLVGTASIMGFRLNEGAELLQAEVPKRRMEVIGDSISAGFGNEAKDQHEKFTPETENASITYGALAARALGAEYVCVAWSGKKMWPDNTIPELYDRILPLDPGSQWDFSKWTPDVVVINLATNDFGPGNPEEEGWVKAYLDFIARVRKNYPKAYIFCATSPMMADAYSKSKDARTTATRYINRVVDECHKAGDPRVTMVDLPAQTGALGFGAAWHPSARQHENSAEVLEKAIREKLGW